VKSISRIWVASVVIVAAASGWGCSYRAGSADDSWAADSSSYALFISSPANISDTSPSVAYGSLEGDPAVVRSGYTDPRWGRADEAVFSAVDNIDNRVLEIPRALDWHNTSAAMLVP
jgi:hypothetical protein